VGLGRRQGRGQRELISPRIGDLIDSAVEVLPSHATPGRKLFVRAEIVSPQPNRSVGVESSSDRGELNEHAAAAEPPQVDHFGFTRWPLHALTDSVALPQWHGVRAATPTEGLTRHRQ
jgi:hypothetical protein